MTLSYFIEPNPGERGWTRRHRYASHGLRFRVKMATETVDEFRARINQAARDEEEGAPAGGGEDWLLGTFRDRGSLHSDFWFGSAADLAERDAIGVFPVGGWWKEKPYLERFDGQARYALIVTIRAPGSQRRYLYAGGGSDFGRERGRDLKASSERRLIVGATSSIDREPPFQLTARPPFMCEQLHLRLRSLEQ